MADFTCALYLGMRHGSATLPPWRQLTTGKPAALLDPPLARDVAGRLAQMIGCECAVVAPSTLHVFMDLFAMLDGSGTVVYVDAGIYPIARWGIERIAWRGVPVQAFPRHDADTLQLLLRRNAGSGRRPVVVADGVCPVSGRPAPIADYLAALDGHGGSLIMDDTQALGILGHDPSRFMPYGLGGGGSLRWSGLTDPRVWVVSSLAKGFGVPLAVLAGDASRVEAFERHSQTRMHCSPPNAATLGAASSAIGINRRQGAALRQRLLACVRRFRARLREIGLSTQGGVFPVQTLVAEPWMDNVALHGALSRRGVHTVLHQPRAGKEPRITFMLTASHRDEDIDNAVGALAAATWPGRRAFNVREPAGGEL